MPKENKKAEEATATTAAPQNGNASKNGSGEKMTNDGKSDSSHSAANASSSLPSYLPMNLTWWKTIISALLAVGLLHLLYTACSQAFEIRLYAIKEYGRLIHEFDPYFNYRATEYLYEHGWKAFATWFDYLVWYPLGRPVGTTIYPGMQVTSVFIKNHILPSWSVNDVCVFVPVWFGVLATLSVFFLTYECTRPSSTYQSVFVDIPVIAQVYKYAIKPGLRWLQKQAIKYTGTTLGLSCDSYSDNKDSNSTDTSPLVPVSPWTPWFCATFAAGIMAVVPAHLLRSIGGGYDNESIAMTAMVLTFACWTRSLRDDVSEYVTIFWGVITGFAYFYMVAAWGGYVFVLNLVGVHAALLVLVGRYSTKLHRAYTCFFAVGTILATRIPVVGLTPLKSLEQIGPLLAFAGMQLIEICEVIKRKRDIKSRMAMWKLRVQVFTIAGVVTMLLVLLLAPKGYFGPISSRVRGLFVKHTKTGNPLVDSVAEHQAASPEAYYQYLNVIIYLAPYGLATTCLAFWNDASSFILVYALAAYFFSHKMVRLILLTAPIASVAGGIALGRVANWTLGSLTVGANGTNSIFDLFGQNEKEQGNANNDQKIDDSSNNSGSNGGKKSNAQGIESKIKKSLSTNNKNKRNKKSQDLASESPPPQPVWSLAIRFALGLVLCFVASPMVTSFYNMCHELARHISHPTIVQKGTTHSGETVIIDDYRQAYFWLKENTPEDARIMAWWDYGYQITGIANRTTIADGNTWNHEHIALLGRTLTGPEREAHRIARHLADYVLVWAGGGGDDLAKSPHLRRIANSVYRGLCREPTCREFGFYSDRSPTRDMKESLLFKLVMHNLETGVEVDKNRFKEVYKSRYGKVRIYKILSVSKESKDWVADPVNRICDAPGSWFCRGQYPPALEKVLKEKRDFKQLEDFNAKGKEDDSEYQRQYMENLLNKQSQASAKPKGREKTTDLDKVKIEVLSPIEIDAINEVWEDSISTTLLWQLISRNEVNDLVAELERNPQMAHARSADGRGPMWWAHEYRRNSIVNLLKRLGVSEDRQDKNGITPLSLSGRNKK